MGNNDITILLLMWGIYHYLGKSVDGHYKYQRRLFIINQPYTKACWICGGTVDHEEVTIDHVVPMSIVKELELYKLIFDHRNFMIAHKSCNSARGNNIDDLPPKIKEKILDLYSKRDMLVETI
jgi:5-methylcytosine-specific restriction endonuclease McrA